MSLIIRAPHSFTHLSSAVLFPNLHVQIGKPAGEKKSENAPE